MDIEVLSRMLLTIGEEQGRLALDDPDFPPERLLASSWALLDFQTDSALAQAKRNATSSS